MCACVRACAHTRQCAARVCLCGSAFARSALGVCVSLCEDKRDCCLGVCVSVHAVCEHTRGRVYTRVYAGTRELALGQKD